MKLSDYCDINVGTVLSRVTSKDNQGESYAVFSIKVALKEEAPTTIYSNVEKEHLLLAKAGDVVMSLTQQKVFIITEEEAGMIIPSTFAHFRIHQKEILSEYLKWYFLHSDAYQRKLHLLQHSGGVNFLKINDLKQIDLPALSLDKQEKLAKLMHTFEREQELYQQKMALFQAVINDYGNQQLKQGDH